VNHAHNDFLEVALETGVFGIALMLAFLAWFGRRAWAAWRTDREGANLARAATLAIVAVLGFSLVEYPLRTSAMAVIFAMSCAFLLPARSSGRSASRREKAKPTEAGTGLRHMEAAE
jgi:O-antigen ligase